MQTVSNEKYAIGVAVTDAASGGSVVVEIISTQSGVGRNRRRPISNGRAIPVAAGVGR